MSRRTRSSPEGQGVTFVELFFDLVFVFAVTQVTGLLRNDLTAAGALRFVVVFWIVWWGWTQFTWALNSADTTHHGIQVLTLASVVVAFAMAMGVGRAYDGSGLWFALPYVALRSAGLGVYWWAAAELPARRRAVAGFSAWSSLGLAAAIAGGLAGGGARTALWALTIALDLFAAARAGRLVGWDLNPAHFVERHGLFVILALGESLIAAGIPAVDAPRSGALVLTALLAVALTCLLWWTYFAHTKPAVEETMESLQGPAQSAFARDAFSLLHFPLLCGIVAVAAALEEAVAHPGEPLSSDFAALFAAGVALFLVSTSLVHRRAGHGWLAHRIALAAVLAAAAVLVRAISPAAVLIAGAAGLAIVALAEERLFETSPAG